MREILKQIVTGHNEFASGGLLLMIVGGIGVFLRSLPWTLWRWIERQTTMLITVDDEDVAFVWVKEWLLEQTFMRRVRRVDVDTTLRGENVALIPAPGRHWFWHGGRPFLVYFYRSEETKQMAYRRSESLTFQTIGRDQRFLRQFVHDVAACHKRRLGVQSSLYMYDDGWTRVESYAPRLLDSVILGAGEKEHLLRDIRKFKSSGQRYRQLGVPYHRGYLLYGPPGTGKTSLVSAIGAKFEMSIYAVNLTDFNDRSLMHAINDVSPDSIVLFEDIDCMASGRPRGISAEPSDERANGTRAEKNDATQARVTLSGLLNVLDGFNAPENVLFAMTSNHIEALDAALLRPGRIDYRLYMGPASERQKVELYCRFFPLATEIEAELFVETHRSVETMAEFQGLLLRLERDCTELDELVAKV
jgi:mitochondrial chaperone BCS1